MTYTILSATPASAFLLLHALRMLPGKEKEKKIAKYLQLQKIKKKKRMSSKTLTYDDIEEGMVVICKKKVCMIDFSQR